MELPLIAHVEDNVDNRLLVKVILRGRCRLLEYEDGTHVAADLAGHHPDLVLLDISLPGKDGVTVLGELRASPSLRSVPVVALTAHAMHGDRERFLALGFDEYLTKPILDQRAFRQAIFTQLERARSPLALAESAEVRSEGR